MTGNGRGVPLVGPTVLIDLERPAVVLRPATARTVHLLVVHAGRPVAWLPLPDAPERITTELVVSLLDEDSLRRLAAPRAGTGGGEGPGSATSAPDASPAPLTVAVCTRDRPASLRRCLAAIARLRPAAADVLVVDSASRDATTAAVAREAGARVVRCDRPGLSVARNTALAHAHTEWIAFTDDDAEVSAGWLAALVPALRAGAACVTGPVVPANLETRAQALFEAYGGLNRGFDPRSFDATFLRAGWRSPPTWSIGAGASMAVAKDAVQMLGGFDPMLGAGTRAACSEDTDLFYRLLHAGRRIEYAPEAWVLHHHRASFAELRRQLWGYGGGHAAAQWKAFRSYGDVRGLGRVCAGLPWLHARRLLRSLLRRSPFPPSLILAELIGGILGPFRWRSEARGRTP